MIDHEHMVGSITENILLRYLASGDPLDSMVVGDLQGQPFPQLQADAPAHEAYTLFSSGQSAVAVMNGDVLEGIVTKSDLLEFWAHTRSQ
jgi:cystathionine beta-synthase